MTNVTLDEIKVTGSKVNYHFSVDQSLEKYFKKNNHMFLKYNYEIDSVPESILAIPLVANIIPLVWLTNSTIKLKQLDKDFYDCLPKIKDAYQEMFPNVSLKGSIHVENIIENSFTPEKEAACLFSGGLDALTTFLRNQDKNPFLITEYGWHENDIEYSDVWEADKKNAEQFALERGLDNILIESNYGNFVIAKAIDRDFSKRLGDSWWHGLHHGLAIISAAIPLAYHLKVSYIYIASSNSTEFTSPCASDPTIDNLIRYGNGGVIHDAFELTRQDKVAKVVEYFSKSSEEVNIRVCFKSEENCCKCEKCLRTIFGIIAEGGDPRRFGFKLPSNVSEYLHESLNAEVKFLTNLFMFIYWEGIQKRMLENSESVLFQDILLWFNSYDFKKEKKKSLLTYRITNFSPIIKRKIKNRVNMLVNIKKGFS